MISVSAILSFTLLLLACLGRALGQHSTPALRCCVGVGGLAGFGLWSLAITQPDAADAFWLNDSLSRAVMLTVSTTAVVLALLNSSPVTLSHFCWSAGLCGLAASSSHPLLLWAAFQFSILAILFFGRTAGDSVPLWKRHSTSLIGSGLFTVGLLLLLLTHPASPPSVVGTILLIGGMGGALGWFPFPRTHLHEDMKDPVDAAFGQRILPAFTAGVVIWRLTHSLALSDQQSFLFVMAALFSLAMSSLRLFDESRLSRRLVLTAFATLSYLIVAAFLQNWEQGHPAQGWSASTNLPGPATLFTSILLCESLVLLLLTTGLRCLNHDRTGADAVDVLAGGARRQPFASVPIILGLASLSGMPPLPGFWWRCGLVMTCLLPHRQSSLTMINERDNSMSLLAAALLLLMILNCLGNLRMLERVLFEHPFRLRPQARKWSTIVATGIVLIGFTGVMCYPFSVDHAFYPVTSVPTPPAEPEPTAPPSPEM